MSNETNKNKATSDKTINKPIVDPDNAVFIADDNGNITAEVTNKDLYLFNASIASLCMD